MANNAEVKEETASVEKKDIEMRSDDGTIFVQLSYKPLDLMRLLYTEAAAPNCGGIANFIGTTRDNFDSQEVVRLEYDAYPQMALKKMMEIGVMMKNSAEGIHRVVISHRLGLCPVLDASVIFSAASEHRGSALKAVQMGINTLKAVVPIWKKEVYSAPPDTPIRDAAWKKNSEYQGPQSPPKATASETEPKFPKE